MRFIQNNQGSQMNLLTIIIKNMRSRLLRTALTLLGVGVSTAAFVAMLGLANNLEDTLKTTYKKRGTDLIVVENGMADILTSTINQEYGQKIKEIPGVEKVAAILVDFQSIKFKQYVLVYGWEMGSYLFDEIKISGARPKNDFEALIGNAASKKLGKKVGDEIKIKGATFVISGIFQSQSVLEEGGIIISLPKLQSLKKIPGSVTMLNIGIKTDKGKINRLTGPNQQVQAVAKQIENLLPEVEVKNVDDFVTSNTPVALALNFTWAISIVAFIISILGITNTMVTSILERTKEIGILIAMGWRNYRIMLLVLFESTCMGFLGGFLGLFLGYGLMQAFTYSPQLAGIMQVSFNLIFMLKVIIGSVALGFVSGLYPALRAISINPLEVLRNE
jgi:putative ABC transport system permease protein